MFEQPRVRHSKISLNSLNHGNKKVAGLLISFEGGEGCGKSTQLNALAARIEGLGRRVHKTREPGGTSLGEALRNLLQHDTAGAHMCPKAELLLFAAARAQLVEEVLTPALESGQVVLCDRFIDSTTAYQGAARALNRPEVDVINQFATTDLKPALTLLIDLPVEIGLERVRQRSGGKLDRMESEAIAFFQAVRQGYLDLAASEPERFLVFDGSAPKETLEATIWNAIEPRIT